MKISAIHICHILNHGLKALAVSLMLTVSSSELLAQSDTCFVSIDITQRDAFALTNGSKGELKIENGKQVLVTPCPIVKIVNKSTGVAIDKNDGRFRVLTFNPGAATTYDYGRKSPNDGTLVFKSVTATNMRAFIYFLLPNREANIAFRLENIAETERVLVTRPATEDAPVVAENNENVAPADKKPVDANDLQRKPAEKAPTEVKEAVPAQPTDGGQSSSWWPWIITLLAVAGAAGYAYYLRRKEEKALWADPIGGGDENIVPMEQRVMVKQVRDLQQRLQASISSDRDHTLRLEHSEKDRKEALRRATKAEEDFKIRADKAEEDFKTRASEAEKEFNKRAEQAEKSAEERAYSAEQQARSRVAAAEQKSEQEIEKAQQQAALAIANAEAKASREIREAQQQAEAQVNQALEDKVKGIEDAREEAYQRATREYNEHVEAIQKDATTRITAAETEAANRINAAETEAASRINAAETNATNRINAAESRAKEITETAEQVANEALATKQAAIDEACQPLFDRIGVLEEEKSRLEKVHAETIASNERTLAATQKNSEEAMAQLKAKMEAAVAQEIAEKNKAIAEAKNEKDTLVAQTIAEKESVVAQALAEKEAVVAQALAEKNEAVEQARNSSQAVIDQAITEKETAIAQAQQEKENELARIVAEKDATITLYRNSLREEHLNERNKFVAQIKGQLDRVSEQMSLLREALENNISDNNYSNTTMHMARKEADFERWFEKSILEAGEDGPETVADVRQMMQEQILQLLSGNYSWLTELIRFKAYAGISADFQREFKRASVSVEAIRKAHTAMEAILGTLGISIIVPQLFAEEFNGELHRNCNAPIVNSFYPKGFDERRQQNRGIICDVLRVGIELDGQSIQMPEVSTF